eukprot:GFYU01010344.1.p1 GENE.GFYU01010344.1~~GFYU01010344.1.p1  ORF type:complete len:606 (-),score=219.40 GFYU01010344.1:25-1611(-)
MLPDLTKTIKSFKTALKDDVKMLEKGGLSPHKEMALRFRINFKRVATTLMEIAKLNKNKPGAAFGMKEDKKSKKSAAKVVDDDEDDVEDEPVKTKKSTKGSDGNVKASAESKLPDAGGERLVKDGEILAGQVESEAELVALADRFNKWIDDQGFPVNKIQATHIPGWRIATTTKEKVRAEELYIAVPNRIIMQDSTAMESDAGAIFRDLDRGSRDNFHKLLMFLLFESKKKDSFWAPYIEVLPKDYNHVPMMFDDDVLDELEGTGIPQQARDRMEKYKRSFKGMKNAVFNKYEEFKQLGITWNDYIWAANVLDSRSIWWHGERHLVPLLDLINCKVGPNPQRVHSTDYDYKKDTADTRAGWTFDEGEQLFEDYGQPNWTYYFYHGFFLEDNYHDCVKMHMTIDPLLSDTKKKKATSNMRSAGQSEVEICISPNVIPPEAWEWISAVFPKDNKYERLSQIVMDAILAYPTTRKADGQLLEDESMSVQRRSAILFRKSQKDLLYEVYKKCKKLAKKQTDRKKGRKDRDEL